MQSDECRYFGPPTGHSTVTYTYEREATPRYEPPTAACVRDRGKRLFRVSELDDTTTEFHDRAVRFLVVEPDPDTGELEPVMERGGPKVIYLCKEAGS
jgi:hypothetical protein